MTRRLLILVAGVAVLVATAATAGADGHYPGSVFTGQLGGDNEVPAVDTNGSGYVSVTVSPDGQSLDFRLYANDLEAVTQAHIHVGAEGENGPPVAFLYGPADPPEDSDGLLAEGTLTEADLIPVDGVFDGTMDTLVNLIRSGETYVNVHTTANPAGEIRDQLTPGAFNLAASLSGSNEVPPVTTDGTGFAALRINSSQTAVAFTVITHGMVDITQAHIHIGPSGVNGPVAAFLFGFADPAVTRDGILATGTITEGDLIPTPDVFDGTMETLIDHLRAGTAYVNVHTVANPPGEIRGQTEGLARGTAGATFTDDDDSVHEGDIEVLAASGITRGCNPPDNDEFCPEDELTRGQGAAFFHRALNLLDSDTDFFTDDDDSIFEADINSVAAVGITVGCNPPDNDEFCPDGSMTRGQWASFMVRALGLTEGGGDDLFTDDDDSVHEDDIDRIATAGITLGCNPPDNDRFCPEDTVTRAQAASFFVRAMGWGNVNP